MLLLRLRARYLCVQECFELMTSDQQPLDARRVSKCSIFVFLRRWVLLFRASWLAVHRIFSGSSVTARLTEPVKDYT